MDGLDIALVAIGCFYALAAFLLLRAALTSHFLDKALAAITLKPAPAASLWQTRWLLASAVLLHLGGVALMVRATLAVPLFVASMLAQVAYVYGLAPMYFDRVDEPDPVRRRQTRNAMVVFAAATLFVVWAALDGRLFPVADLTWVSKALALAVMAWFAAYFAHALFGRASALHDDES